MSRAELRRAAKEQKKANTVTYTFTQAQFDEKIQRAVREVLSMEKDKIRKEAYEEGVDDGFILMIGLPMKVLIDHYWPKSYEKQLPGFVDHILDYKEAVDRGEIDINELVNDIYELAGVKLTKGDYYE